MNLSILRRFARPIIYGCVVAIAIVVYQIEVRTQQQPDVLGVIPDPPSQQASASADQSSQASSADPRSTDKMNAFMAMNQLITTLSTGLVGALGFLLSRRSSTTRPRDLWAALASFVCVGLSLYFGYRGYVDLIHLLNIPNFDLSGGLISSDRGRQFGFFVLAVFFFADFAFYELTQEGTTSDSAS